MFLFAGLLKRTTFLAFLLLAGLWIAFGWRLSQQWTAAWGTPKQTEVDRLVEQLSNRDPEAGREVAELKARSDSRAFGATLTLAERRGGLDAMRQMAAESKLNAKPAALQLAELALDPKLNTSELQRHDVLLAHGPAIDVLHQGSAAAAEEYLSQLKEAAKDPSTWSLVRDDPVGLVVWMHVKDGDLRSYYQTERDWLADVLAELVDTPERLVKALESAKNCHPLPKNAVVELQLGSAGFELFQDYCPMIFEATAVRGLPLDEVLEVVFANRDYFDDAKTKEEPAVSAKKLAEMHANEKAVWKHARQTTLALRLKTVAPATANRLLEKFGADDVAAFLFTAYESEAAVAAQGIDRFGDLGFYILNKYRDDARIHQYLQQPDVGARLVPYLARFGDRGLDQLAQNRAWLDKYFELDGTEKNKEWWTQIPGGAALDVARNFSQGVPNEWSELGWGALDVADAALLVVSFGGSSAGTAGKQAAKVAAKKAAVESVERTALTAGRGARLAARKAIAAGTRGSVLRRTASALRTGTLTAGKALLRPAQFAGNAVRRASVGWASLSPAFRRLMARSLLGVGLFVTLSQRTLPMMGNRFGEIIESVARQPLESLGEALRQLLQTFGFDPSQLGSAAGVGLFVFVLGLLLFSTWIFRPRPKLAYRPIR